MYRCGCLVGGRKKKLIEGAHRFLTPGAPLDCNACQNFFFEKDGNIARARFAEEKITDDDCNACEFIRVEPRTFEWMPHIRILFYKWHLWRQTGLQGPDGYKEFMAFYMLSDFHTKLQCQIQM